jgi:hypothetical protein
MLCFKVVSSEPPNDESPKGEHDTRATDVHYWVEHGGGAIELRGGQLLVGRSAMCRLVLDDPLVSRQHAEFRLVGKTVYLFDLKSVNGVFVNGRRIEQKAEIRPGDRILVGEQELTLLARSLDKDTKPHVPSRRRFVETQNSSVEKANPHSEGANRMVEDPSVPVTADHPAADPRDEFTFQGEALELLTGIADKVLALGRGDEAERILGTYMTNLLASARAGATVGPRTGDMAAIYAVKLATVTGKGSWIDYAMNLFSALRRPLPSAVIDELYGLLRKTKGVDLIGVREYVAVLHSVQARFGPAERFLVQRIEGLERLASLR